MLHLHCQLCGDRDSEREAPETFIDGPACSASVLLAANFVRVNAARVINIEHFVRIAV
jgi:hypothetical protein